MNPKLITHMVDRSCNGRRQSGGGLGLTLAGWVARVHDGELRAANRPDGGAVFTPELPRAD